MNVRSCVRWWRWRRCWWGRSIVWTDASVPYPSWARLMTDDICLVIIFRSIISVLDGDAMQDRLNRCQFVREWMNDKRISIHLTVDRDAHICSIESICCHYMNERIVSNWIMRNSFVGWAGSQTVKFQIVSNPSFKSILRFDSFDCWLQFFIQPFAWSSPWEFIGHSQLNEAELNNAEELNDDSREEEEEEEDEDEENKRQIQIENLQPSMQRAQCVVCWRSGELNISSFFFQTNFFSSSSSSFFLSI